MTEAYGVSTARPTSLPFCKSVSASLASGERHRRYRNWRDLPGANEIEQFLRFAQVSDVAALNRDRL